MTAKESAADDVLDALLFGDPRGRKSANPVLISAKRSLTPDDVPDVENNVGTEPEPFALKRVGARHHALAQHVAKGLPPAEISLITGYTPQYIQRLREDPAFAELVEYYAQQVEQRFVDVIERMRQLGLSSIEELQSRLDTKPEDIGTGTLITIAEAMILKPLQAKAAIAAANKPNAGMSFKISFVGGTDGASHAPQRNLPASDFPSDPGPIIDVKPNFTSGEE